MIELKDIKKTYKVGENKVEALKGVSLSFRKNEYVSILGQSGCGKTTFLNVLGGLDNYNSGDLLVDGKTTKNYRDADWDAYRSKYVGFVFQSYNLIMHLNVLENVELSLSIAGMSKEERKQKALSALESVGLGDQVHKKPNQLSGGQMQRVAIARAIVGDPQIILADEPTGALDTQTSVQILDILKELSKTKLVVMVTHNHELAEKYSSRIVKMQDGLIVDDSKPYTPKKQNQKFEKTNKKKEKKPSMNFWTALSLSFRNLLTKKTRTFLTAFAGSIGIIGIALILGLSSGFQAYVNKTQSDTMSSYPITLQQTSVNLLSTLDLLNKNTDTQSNSDDEIGVNALLEKFLQNSTTNVHANDLAGFKTYLEENINDEKINGIQYIYDVNLNVYNNNYETNINKLNPVTMSAKSMAIPQLVAMFNQLELWQELLSNQSVLNSQYNLIKNSRWPESADEVVIMLNENGQIDDFVLYALGLRNISEIDSYLDYMIDPVNNPKPIFENETTYQAEDFLSLQYKLFLEADYFVLNGDNTYTDIRTLELTQPETYKTYMQEKLQSALTLKVVGVAKPKEKTKMTGSIGAVGYTPALINHIIQNNNTRTVVTEQIANPALNILTNSAFSAGESYLSNLKKLGIADTGNPKEIRIYPSNFESKDYIISFIDTYNQTKTEREDQIEYTDYIGILISSVSTIISAITYVLIAFVSISLIVSSIMIGIITYVSVLERTKEIGILRSVGARKRDVSNVFNAETMLIGFTSGFFGIAVTYLLSIPANIILENIIDLPNVIALPILPALFLILISVVLTLVSGLIPARLAAKKDPVKALREE